ncbi:GAF domain-containing protein [Candidatus Viridilinea mediisalina]|uniref:Histidine kinase n=1 Tax=Candidatus Viridilinea mediisalina TaxID=2024553 RepID=A0A2A6RH24_9CHLR|nr:GAF domain-containing protein [Candidatus Viridilinea mediisalina]PDW02241.1 hypothetical protein CJ255_14980 [Candidatus Viridilinea mediisalina]
MFRILILDDDALFNRTLQRWLERNEHLRCLVRTAESETAAYAAVAQAEAPFDLFLIDMRLGPVHDGIEVLSELQRLSPTSQAIVFTEADNNEAGLRAYRAGAYRYLHKPLDLVELELVLRSLWELIQVQQERDWLRIFATIAEASQRPLDVAAMAQEVVKSAQRLGFTRVCLWMVDGDGKTLVGVEQVGNVGIEDFQSCRLAYHDSPYLPKVAQSREPYRFHGFPDGPTYLTERYAATGYRPTSGEWIALPLWSEERRMGVLVLDNGDRPRPIRREEMQQLALFVRLVAAALERAQLYEQEQQRRKEVELLAAIGRHISECATETSSDELISDELIKEIFALIKQSMQIEHFFLAFHNEHTDMIEKKLEYRHGRLYRKESFPYGRGLTSHIIKHNEAILLASEAEIKAFRQHHLIQPRGLPARSWIGVPLRIGQRAFGAIVISSTTQEHAFKEHDRLLLSAIADHVAGALQASRLREAEHRTARRFSVLQRVGEELPKRALLDEGQMWRLALNSITAEYGLRFNRAMLFLLDHAGATLVGRYGVGHLQGRQARQSWRRDAQRNVNLTTFLKQLDQGALPSTPVDEHLQGMRIKLRGADHAFATVLHERKYAVVAHDEATKRMPSPFIAAFGSAEYALFPIAAADRIIGLLVVDNLFNLVPIATMPLADLERLLSQVALVHETLLQRQASRSLLEVSQQTLSSVADQPLTATLNRICKVACTLTGASCALILPFQQQGQNHFEVVQIGSAGLQTQDEAIYLASDLYEQLRQGETIELTNPKADLLDPLTRAFFEREGYAVALLFPIFDHENGICVGTIQLYYRHALRLETEDHHQAKLLADLAGAVIHTTEAYHRARREELLLQADLLKVALNLRPREEGKAAETKFIHELLQAASQLLALPESRVAIFMRGWEAADDGIATEIRYQYFLVDNEVIETTEKNIDRGIVGLVIRDAQSRLIDDVQQSPWRERFFAEYSPSTGTRGELDVPIVLDGQVLGVIDLESPLPRAYHDVHKLMIERLAATAALALGNLRRQQYQRRVMAAAQEVVAPSDLEQTLKALIEAARQVAPGVSAITLWYKAPEQQQIIPYSASFGLMHPGRTSKHPADPESPVAKVMAYGEPIFASELHKYPILYGDFIHIEQIVSVAALPLVAYEEAVGVLFFNYRTTHHFTAEEQTLFQTMAAFAVASVRDALHLEQLQRETQRLDLAKQITEAIGTTIAIEQIQQKVLATLSANFVGMQICLMLYDDEERALNFAPNSTQHYTFKDDFDYYCSIRIDRTKAIACRVARTTLAQRRVVCENVGDVSQAPDYLEANCHTRSELCVSLVGADHGNLLGLLVLESEQLNAFNHDDEELAIAAARAIGIAIERANQSSQLRFHAAVAEATVWSHEFSHDINKAITLIRNRAYLLRDQVDPEHQPHLDQIATAAQQIVTFVKASSATESQVLALNTWLQSYLDHYDVPERLHCTFQPSTLDLHIVAVPLLLERVMLHILRNAAEAAEGEGDAKINISIERINQYARVRVQNSGPDIDPAILPRLWTEPVSTKHARPEGAEGGLGLLFVRAAVEMMGGKVRLFATPKQGVTVTFTLPLKEPEP